MFRITPQSMINTALLNHRSQTARLGRVQAQIASGQKYSRPSDAPRDTHAIRVLERAIRELGDQRGRIDSVETPLNTSVSTLLDVNSLISRARQIALEAPQTFGAGEINALVAEVDSMIQRAVSLANTSVNGDYLYAGAAVETRPFELVDNGDGAPRLVYHGSRQTGTTAISDSIDVDSAFAGNEIFMPRARTSTLLTGSTGAASGVGTDSLTGRATLSVRHTSTVYEAGSGLAAGTGSSGGDTILGQTGTHTVTLTDTSGTGAFGTISLNGGPPVNWTSADTNLQVAAVGGAMIHVDTSGIAAGFSGTVNLEAQGTLSVDGGVTTTAIDFSSNQVVASPEGIANIDSSAIRFTGDDHLEFPGTSDVISALLELKDDLLNQRGLSNGERNDALVRRADDLDRLGDHVLKHVGIQSASLLDLERMAARNENTSLELNSQLASVGATDYASAVVEMQTLELALQFNYASISIVQSNNLLDFIG